MRREFRRPLPASQGRPNGAAQPGARFPDLEPGGYAAGQRRSRDMSIRGFCWPPSISIIVPFTKWARSEAR